MGKEVKKKESIRKEVSKEGRKLSKHTNKQFI